MRKWEEAAATGCAESDALALAQIEADRKAREEELRQNMQEEDDLRAAMTASMQDLVLKSPAPNYSAVLQRQPPKQSILMIDNPEHFPPLTSAVARTKRPRPNVATRQSLTQVSEDINSQEIEILPPSTLVPRPPTISDVASWESFGWNTSVTQTPPAIDPTMASTLGRKNGQALGQATTRASPLRAPNAVRLTQIPQFVRQARTPEIAGLAAASGLALPPPAFIPTVTRSSTLPVPGPSAPLPQAASQTPGLTDRTFDAAIGPTMQVEDLLIDIENESVPFDLPATNYVQSPLPPHLRAAVPVLQPQSQDTAQPQQPLSYREQSSLPRDLLHLDTEPSDVVQSTQGQQTVPAQRLAQRQPPPQSQRRTWKSTYAMGHGEVKPSGSHRPRQNGTNHPLGPNNGHRNPGREGSNSHAAGNVQRRTVVQQSIPPSTSISAHAAVDPKFAEQQRCAEA